MKLQLITKIVAFGLATTLSGSMAFAEGGSIFFNDVSFLAAPSDCASLGIQKGERFSLIADTSVFGLDQVGPNGFTPFLQYLVPAQGNYVVRTDGSFSFSD